MAVAQAQAQPVAKPPGALESKPGAAPSTATPAPASSLTAFSVKLHGNAVALSWSAPKEIASVRVLRRAGTAVASATDDAAQLVYAGPNASATHPRLELSSAASDLDPAALAFHYAAFACTAPEACEATPLRATLHPGLAAALRKGGYVFYFRHATAEVCDDVEPLGKADATEKPGWWKSCERDCPKATTRQLSDKGRGEAKQLGDQLRRLKVPVASILTSEFCRAQETARLMALRQRGKAVPIKALQVLTSFVYDEPNRCANTYKLLAEAPKPGTNTVLVGHKGNECPVVGALDSAAVAIFKPKGPEGAQSVAVLRASDWANYE